MFVNIDYGTIFLHYGNVAVGGHMSIEKLDLGLGLYNLCLGLFGLSHQRVSLIDIMDSGLGLTQAAFLGFYRLLWCFNWHDRLDCNSIDTGG